MDWDGYLICRRPPGAAQRAAELTETAAPAGGSGDCVVHADGTRLESADVDNGALTLPDQ